MHRYQPKSLTHQIVNSTAGEGTGVAQASLTRDLVDGANPLGEAGANPHGTQAAQASLTRDLVGPHLAAGENGANPLGVLAHLGASPARAARAAGVVLHLGDLGVALRAASPNPQKDVTHGAAHHLGAHHLGAHQDGEASPARVHLTTGQQLTTGQDGASPARVHLTTGQHLATGKIHGHQLLLGVVIVESLARAQTIGLDGVPSKKLKL